MERIELATPLRRRFYRILGSRRAGLEAFKSNAELGIEPRRPLSRREMDRWHGVSHVAAPQSARRRMQVSPWLGTHVAVIDIPSDARVRIEQTGSDPDRFTIWAAADDLLSWVVAILSLVVAILSLEELE
jgi:hypothetical protein